MQVSSVGFGNRVIKTGNDLRKSFNDVVSNKISQKEFIGDIVNIKMPKKEIQETVSQLEKENPKNLPFAEIVKGFIARLSD